MIHGRKVGGGALGAAHGVVVHRVVALVTHQEVGPRAQGITSGGVTFRSVWELPLHHGIGVGSTFNAVNNAGVSSHNHPTHSAGVGWGGGVLVTHQKAQP